MDGHPVTIVVGNGSQSLPTGASFPVLTNPDCPLRRVEPVIAKQTQTAGLK